MHHVYLGTIIVHLQGNIIIWEAVQVTSLQEVVS